MVRKTVSVTFFEIRHRLLSFVLGLLGVAVAVALVVFVVTLGRASGVETQRLMESLGFNLLILPAGVEPAEFWSADVVQGEMPEEYVERLAGTPGVGADHHVAALQEKVSVEGYEALLTGVLPGRRAVDGGEGEAMGHRIERGRCWLGFALAEALGLREGDAIRLHGKMLQVERRLPEESTRDDIRIWAHLRDVQQMLGMEGHINAIYAVGRSEADEPPGAARARINAVLPGVVVTQLRSITAAGAATRRMMRQYARFMIALAVVGCAAWVGLLAALNTRERRSEIGLLRALGFDAGGIAALFVTRAALMGLAGAAAGFALGTALALQWGPAIFEGAVVGARPAYDLLVAALLITPLLAALAALAPASLAVAEDPAAILTEE